jgi:type IV pilus assembly protein PilB
VEASLLKKKAMDEAKLLEFLSRLGYITKDQVQKAISSKEKNEDIDGRLTVVMVNPFNQSAINELRFASKIDNIVSYAAPKRVIEDIINRLYPQTQDILEKISEVSEIEIETSESELSLDAISKEAGEAPIVRLANFLIMEAVNLGASDIHIDPQEKKLVVRYRVDGVLRIFHELPINIKDALTARFKIMANLDISERRKPQDGRIRAKIGNKRVDLRVSTVPVVYGENMVKR